MFLADLESCTGDVETLRRTLLECQAILENASVGIAVTQGRRIARVNPRFAEMLGWPPEALVGEQVTVAWTSPEEGRAVDRLAAPLLARGEPVDFERSMRRRDGTTFQARLRARPMARGARTLGAIWIVEDVSEQRRIVEELWRARAQLEERVRSRTEELAATNDMLVAEIAERSAAEQRVRHLAHHDVLTGLPNRRLLEERLEQALVRARGTQGGLAVMFIDLDRFKFINDSLGHAVGDQLLRAVAGRLCESLRPVDTVARLGGDEFVVLLPDVSTATEAGEVAGRLLEHLSTPYKLGEHVLRVTPSIGVSMYPNDGEDAQSLLGRADAAMYDAKSQGRRCWQLFTQRVRKHAARQLELENALHHALERAEFSLQYQPRFDIVSQRLCAIEALLRWAHPRFGSVSPVEFIPLAEDSGLILPIGEWVLEQACRQLAQWRERGLADVPISVNLSAAQFRSRNFADSVARAMKAWGIGAGQLELEITETTLMRHTDATQEMLQRLVDLGARISIDDFGTGYSSLAYLKRFPVTLLKIDRSFVRDLHTDVDDATIVRAITGLARSLGKRVVAEGVETREQVAFLQECGCDEVQGFLLSRPVDADEITRRYCGASTVAR